MKYTLLQMVNKWITEEHLNDTQLGTKVKHWFWRNEKTTEHWLFEDDEGWSGYGYDDASRSTDDGGDEIY